MHKGSCPLNFEAMAYRKMIMLIACSILLAGKMQAGSRLQLLLKNVVKVKQGTLVVMPILPDSVQLEKLMKRGAEVKVNEYVERINQANQHIRKHFAENYNFSKYYFATDSAEIKTWADYRAYLQKISSPAHYVLQFGNAAQYAGPKFKKLSKYDRDFLGVYEANGTTRVYLNQGKAALFYQEHYVSAVIQNLNNNLKRYYKKAAGESTEGNPNLKR